MKLVGYLMFLLVLLSLCCTDKNHSKNGVDNKNSKKNNSYQINSMEENLDTARNLYSNLKYNFAFDGPDNWKSIVDDSEILRFQTKEEDSGLTFVVIIEELPQKVRMKNDSVYHLNIWEFYNNNLKSVEDAIVKSIIRNDAKIVYLKSSNLLFKDNPAVTIDLRMIAQGSGIEYAIFTRFYQFIISEYVYTIGLHVPNIFYKQNSIYYDGLFSGFHIVENKSAIDSIFYGKIFQDKAGL